MSGRAFIVVGWDGSPNSVAALDCALVEAGVRDARLVLCHVRERSTRGGDHARAGAARQLLARGAERAHRRVPGIDVTRRLLTGSPARQLLRVADGARLLVVGARGTSTSHELRLGPVSDHITRHRHRAVLVVPDAGSRAGVARHRTVVVGVDGSGDSAAALRFAFEEAVRRRTAVRVIHVVDPSTSPAGHVPHRQPRRRRITAADTMRELLVEYAARWPSVRVCAEVRSGVPGVALAAAADGAELLVLGTHKHHDTDPLTCGVTRCAVLHNATCPVAII